MLAARDREVRAGWAGGCFDRIKAAHAATDGEIGATLGLSRTAVCHMRDGSDPMHPWHLEALARAYGAAVVLGVEEHPRSAADPLRVAIVLPGLGADIVEEIHKATDPRSPGGASFAPEESASICAKVRKLLGAAGETFGAVRTRGSR